MEIKRLHNSFAVCKVQDYSLVSLENEYCFKGVLDFSLIGILSKITTILAEHKIGVFAISTYNTDYIFVKEENFCRAIELMCSAGYSIV